MGAAKVCLMSGVMDNPTVRAVAVPISLLLVWQVAVMLAAPSGRTPVPSQILVTGWELISSGDLPSALLQSLGRVFLGFAWAVGLALVLGALMGTYRAAERALDPLIESFRPIAPIALLPLAILWFGTGTPAAAFIVGYAAFFPMIVNTVHGVTSVDQQLIRAARTLGISRLTILLRVVLPGAIPFLFVGARLALGVAWTSIIAAELAVGAKAGGGATGGVGQMMFVFYAYSVDLSGIIVCMISVGVVALIMDRGSRVLEKWMLPWKR
jgi:ABC-type nitrate/sulfonate/bicarbonate transport system permease component